MSFVYVASPYSHVDAEVREHRFNAVSAFTAGLVRDGVVAYSPIAHSHPIAERYSLPGDFEFWIKQNYGMLSKASALYVLRLDGWGESKGVTAEIIFAEQCGIPVTYY